MTTLDEFEKLLNPDPTDSDCTDFFHKGLESGAYNHATKGDFHELLETIASEIQAPNETFERAYNRAIETTATGKALFKAMKSAPETVSRLPAKHKIIAEIQKRADEHFPELPTREQRFAHAIDTDKWGRPYDKPAHVLYEASKSAPGYDTPPARAEPPADIVKADAAARGSAHMQMLELARQHNAANPHLSEAQAYTSVYTSSKNVALKNRMAEEDWSLRGVGDAAYNAQNNPVGITDDYTNPHPVRVSSPRAGSGARPSAKSFDEQVPRAHFDMLPDPIGGGVGVSPGRKEGFAKRRGRWALYSFVTTTTRKLMWAFRLTERSAIGVSFVYPISDRWDRCPVNIRGAARERLGAPRVEAAGCRSQRRGRASPSLSPPQ